jgi:hypothetical protein
MTIHPQNMREIADRIQNLLDEADQKNDDTDVDSNPKSIDDLLTTSADAQKIAAQIDKNKLSSEFVLNSDDTNDLWNAIQNLGKESPVINKENAVAILKVFARVAGKPEISEDSLTETMLLQEKYNANFDDPVSYKYVESALKEASEISPLAKDYALKLAVILTQGSKNRRLDEGLEGVLNAVIYAIDIAKKKDRSDLLHMLDDFETKYQDDNYAFDQNLWNDLMKNLKSLAKEVLHKS